MKAKWVALGLITALLGSEATAQWSITQVTDNSYDDRHCEVSGSKVVWVGAISGYEVFSYDIPSGVTKQLTDDASTKYGPQTDGENISWHANAGGDWEVYLRSGSATTQVTNNVRLDFWSSLDGPNIVWTGDDGHDWEIYHYNTDSGIITNLSDNEYKDDHRKIEGDHVIWWGYPNGGDSEFFLHDLQTGITTRLTNK